MFHSLPPLAKRRWGDILYSVAIQYAVPLAALALLASLYIVIVIGA